MATVDLPRAQRLASRVADAGQKAQAYAVMAQALAKSQPTVARELLERALAAIEESLKDDKSPISVMCQAPALAAAFLPVVEQIDPRLVDEFLWRAVALRRHELAGKGSTTPNRPQSEQPNREDVQLAVALVRYDRALAGVLFAPQWKQIGTPLSTGWEGRGTLNAAAMLDPQRTAAIVERRPDDDARQQEGAKLAKFLIMDDDKRWNHIQREILNLWVVDEEDFGGLD
jgi:hypothetical protein